MTDYVIKGMVHESQDEVQIDLGYVRIVVKRNDEDGPLGRGVNSGVTFWENEYITGQDNEGGVSLEYGGGPLIFKSKGDVDRLMEKLRQNKEIGGSS